MPNNVAVTHFASAIQQALNCPVPSIDHAAHDVLHDPPPARDGQPLGVFVFFPLMLLPPTPGPNRFGARDPGLMQPDA